MSLSFPKSFVETWGATWFDVFSRATEVDLLQTLAVIKCPVYFFAGAKDYNTNSSITTEYYSKVSVPKKDLFLLNDAGHELLVTHSDAFQDIIIRTILPQTSQISNVGSSLIADPGRTALPFI